MKDMEPKLRGQVEDYIDELIVPERLSVYFDQFSKSFPVNMEAYLFGFVVGRAWQFFLMMTLERAGGTGGAEAFKKFLEIIENRTMKIRNNIKLAMNK